MAFYDKSARMAFSVALSLIIHAVLIGLLVSTQMLSEDAEKDTPTAEERTPPSEPPKEPLQTEPTQKDKPAPLQTEPKDPFLTDSPKARTKKERKPSQPPIKTAREKTSSAKADAAKADSDRTDSESAKDKEPTNETEIYVVKKGESLTSIARAHGCTLAELTKLNRNTLKKQKSLFVGAKLRVPKK